MVQLQSATTILKMAGYLSDNSTPELDEAKVRKLKAEADIAEAKAKMLNDENNAGITQIVFNDDMEPDNKGDEENGAET